MRCPKCGYISFDRQKSCGKCSGDLTVVAEQVQGTGVNIVPPFFLGRALGLQQADAVGAAPFVFNDEAVSLGLGSLDDGDLPPEATEEGGDEVSLDLGSLGGGDLPSEATEEGGDEVSLDLGSLGGGDLPSEATEEGGDEVSLDLGSLDDGGRSYGDEAGDDGQVDLDFAGAPVDEEEDNVPAPPILGLGDIDVSDLLPDQADETVGADSVREESAALSGQEGEEGEPASDELRSLLEKEDLVLVGEAEEPEPAVAADDAVVDLSSLVGPGDDFSAAGFEEDEADGPDFDFTLALDDFIEEGESDRDTPAGDQRLGSESEGGKGGAGGADTGKQARPVIADLGLSMERDSE